MNCEGIRTHFNYDDDSDSVSGVFSITEQNHTASVAASFGLTRKETDETDDLHIVSGVGAIWRSVTGGVRTRCRSLEVEPEP